MSQVIDSLKRGTVSARGYVHGRSAKTVPPTPVSRLEKTLLMLMFAVVGALAVIFLGMLFRFW